MIKYKGQHYRTATAAAVIDDAYWRESALLFWIYAVCESKTGTDLPAKAKQLKQRTWDKLPHEIRQGVGQDADTQQRILDTIQRGMCWYIAIEGDGWLAGAKRGARPMGAVHNTLEWIEQFRQRSIVGGSKLLWAEVTSKVERR